jgi:hypothetical protein
VVEIGLVVVAAVGATAVGGAVVGATVLVGVGEEVTVGVGSPQPAIKVPNSKTINKMENLIFKSGIDI